VIALSLVAIVYIGFVALVQADMKKLIAYSSISHMGFVTLGFFLFSQLGVEGGLVQMISHGFVSAAMFLCVGVMYDRMHSRQIADYGGVVNTMPKFAAFMMLFAMANSGLPATSGFVGEFMVILAAVKANFWLGAAAATIMILGAAYTLWMYKRVIYGAVANDQVAALTDVNRREFWLLAAVALLVFWMGLWPKPFIDVMHNSVADLLATSRRRSCRRRRSRSWSPTSTSRPSCPRSCCSAGRASCCSPISSSPIRGGTCRSGSRRRCSPGSLGSARHDAAAADGCVLRDGRRRHARRHAQVHELRRRLADAVLFARLQRGTRVVPGRVVRAGALRAARNDGDDRGRELRDALPRPRAPEPVAVCARSRCTGRPMQRPKRA
jgi:hypothetical protein